MALYQCGILEPVPAVARHLLFNIKPDCDPKAALVRLKTLVDGRSAVIGLGHSLVQWLGEDIKGLIEMPALSGAAVEVPSTPAALWIWLRGDDRGDLVLQSLKIKHAISDAFELRDAIDCFKYQDGRDLSGYIDGTENPEDRAQSVAIVDSAIEGINGSSFVAVQMWLHNLAHFKSLAQSEQDNIIGRRIEDNEEFDQAPDSAHVKRTAQESFDPQAFMLRRSMPWNDDQKEGLVFLSFGFSLDAFGVIMRRMVGLDDGITDALFRFSQPINGAYFWCPPMHEGQLDLRVFNL